MKIDLYEMHRTFTWGTNERIGTYIVAICTQLCLSIPVDVRLKANEICDLPHWDKALIWLKGW